jgi:hypothetical protein
MKSIIRKPGRFGLQGLALLLYILSPLIAFIAYQQGYFFITAICVALLGLAFIIALISR